MPALEDTLVPTPIRQRKGLAHFREDLTHFRAGLLDRGSFLSGWRAQLNPIEVRTSTLMSDSARIPAHALVKEPGLFTEPVLVDGVWRDRAFAMQRRRYTAIRRAHNLRVTMGRDQWQRVLMSGDVGTGSLNGLTGTATATSATSLTGSGFPTATSSAGNAGLQGHIVIALGNSTYGVILSNTATVLTIDQWYAIPVTGGAGTTPAATTGYIVMPGAWFAAWIGLSTNSAAAAAGDILRTADGLFGDGTGAGAATEQAASGLARAFQAWTFPAAGQYQYVHTWTYTGAVSVTIAKVVVCNSLAAAGSLLFLETLLSATATVTASGDTIQVTHTLTL